MGGNEARERGEWNAQKQEEGESHGEFPDDVRARLRSGGTQESFDQRMQGTGERLALGLNDE